MHFLCLEPCETDRNVPKITKNLVLKFHFLLLGALIYCTTATRRLYWSTVGKSIVSVPFLLFFYFSACDLMTLKYCHILEYLERKFSQSLKSAQQFITEVWCFCCSRVAWPCDIVLMTCNFVVLNPPPVLNIVWLSILKLWLHQSSTHYQLQVLQLMPAALLLKLCRQIHA